MKKLTRSIIVIIVTISVLSLFVWFNCNPFLGENSQETDYTLSSDDLLNLTDDTDSVRATTAIPADVLNLTNWKITVPYDNDGNGYADEVKQPALSTFEIEPYFCTVESDTAVAFRAYMDAPVTSSSTSYVRSELRERADNGTTDASWTTTSGTHTLYMKQKITHLPPNRPNTDLGQIHDSGDDVTVFRVEGSNLYATQGDSDGQLISSSFKLNTVYEFKMVVTGGVVYYYWQNMSTPVKSWAVKTSGCYFKAGAYVQSNTTFDSASEYGEVVIYDVSVTHN